MIDWKNNFSKQRTEDFEWGLWLCTVANWISPKRLVPGIPDYHGSDQWSRLYLAEKFEHTSKNGCRCSSPQLLLVINPHMLKVILLTSVLRGGVKLPPRCISASRLARNDIPTTNPMFSRSTFSMALSVTLPDETGSQKSRWGLK